ncbi:MAG: putative manganese transporter [Candidatus Gastranaerophilaceae bacterium]
MLSFFASLPDFVTDAFNDSFAALPLLFLAFVFIEVTENFFCGKIRRITSSSRFAGPFFGGLTAIMPQCGFPVIAASLYAGGYISRGTLLAVFVAASDEALPTFFAFPEKIFMLIPVLFVKFVLAVAAGILLDFVWKKPVTAVDEETLQNDIDDETGCCDEKIVSRKNLIIHPIKHTLHVFVFILAVTLFLSYMNEFYADSLQNILLEGSPLIQPVAAAWIGLIPNCAISLLITMLYIKNSISFASVIAGLASSAGLGVLVLIRKNPSVKDTCSILAILFAVAALAGVFIAFLQQIFAF